MNRYIGPAVLFVSAVFLIVVVQWGTPVRIDWTENYHATDKRPYGAKVLADLLADVFPGQPVQRPGTSLYKRRGQLRPGNYVFVNQRFFLTRPDLHELIRLVAEGSNAFIAASEWTGLLEDTLGIRPRSVFTSEQAVRLNLLPPRRAATAYAYRHVEALYELVPDSVRTAGTPIQLGQVFVSQQKGGSASLLQTAAATNFVAVPWGRGYFFLHAMPQAFGNYNMVHPRNVAYIAAALSYMPPREVFWEEYYTDITYAATYGDAPAPDGGGETAGEPAPEQWNEAKAVPVRKNESLAESTSVFRFLLAHPPLRWALYLTLAALVLFVLFEAKRRQRVVPVVAPLANTSLEFTQTVGRLYYQHQDHRHIAEKKIAYFLEHLRTKYYLNTNHLDAAFYTALARKSGAEPGEVETLFQFVAYIQKQGVITEAQLLDLHRRLQRFTER